MNADSCLLTFGAAEELDYVGGQYIILNTGIKDGEGNDVKRAYSLFSRDDNQKQFELCIKTVPGGKASGHLVALETGAELAFSGPWGKFIKTLSGREKGTRSLSLRIQLLPLPLG